MIKGNKIVESHPPYLYSSLQEVAMDIDTFNSISTSKSNSSTLIRENHKSPSKRIYENKTMKTLKMVRPLK
jgi:hypothetical protein